MAKGIPILIDDEPRQLDLPIDSDHCSFIANVLLSLLGTKFQVIPDMFSFREERLPKGKILQINFTFFTRPN